MNNGPEILRIRERIKKPFICMILKRMQMKNLNEIICEYYSKELKIHLSRKNIGWKQSCLYFLHSYQYIFMYIC